MLPYPANCLHGNMILGFHLSKTRVLSRKPTTISQKWLIHNNFSNDALRPTSSMAKAWEIYRDKENAKALHHKKSVFQMRETPS